MLAAGNISPGDLELFRVTDDVEDTGADETTEEAADDQPAEVTAEEPAEAPA